MAIGWGNPAPLTPRGKFHYYGANGRSLCRKYQYIGQMELEEGRDDHEDNCAECRRRKRKASISNNTDAADNGGKDGVMP